MDGGATSTDHQIEGIDIYDAKGNITTIYGFATLNQENPVSGTIYTGDANCEATVFFTLPAGSANLQAVALRINDLDSDDYNFAIIQRNSGNTAWNLYLGAMVAGTPSGEVTVTNVGTPIALRIRKSGSSFRFSTKSGTTWTTRSTAQTITNQQNTAGIAVVTNGATVSRLVSQPITSSEYDTVFDAI
jgi:hypothetical protein